LLIASLSVAGFTLVGRLANPCVFNEAESSLPALRLVGSLQRRFGFPDLGEFAGVQPPFRG
jgi:hypothetical protein